MTQFLERLQATTTARWLSGVPVRPRERRGHYYQALQSILDERFGAAGGGGVANVQLQAADIMAPDRPKSTLNHLFRKPDAGSLVETLRRENPSLRRCQPYHDAVQQCGAELKVWTYRPYRDGWLTELRRIEEPHRRPAAKSLVLVVAEWATRQPAAAAYRGYAAPLAAIEDLMVVSRAPIDPADATALLSQVVRLTLDRYGRTPLAVLNVVHDELMRVAFDADGGWADAVADITDALSTLARVIPALGDAERVRLVNELHPALAEILDLLCPTV